MAARSGSCSSIHWISSPLATPAHADAMLLREAAEDLILDPEGERREEACRWQAVRPGEARSATGQAPGASRREGGAWSVMSMACMARAYGNGAGEST